MIKYLYNHFYKLYSYYENYDDYININKLISKEESVIEKRNYYKNLALDNIYKYQQSISEIEKHKCFLLCMEYSKKIQD